MREFWNERYSTDTFVYGTKPNHFFKQKLDAIDYTGDLLLPLEGEGRNAVYAASKGWNVDAFDFSEEAKRKAINFARQQGLRISYDVLDASDYFPPTAYYDVVGIVFAHFPPDVRINFHRKLIKGLKPGGHIILEVFHKDQIGNNTGGPPNIDLLYSTDDLQSDFNELDMLYFEHLTVQLDEGPFHKGQAEVIRLHAQIK